MTTGSASRSPYPALVGAPRDAVAARLVEIVSLRHPEVLTPDQLDQIAVEIGAQLRATERLHQFDLSNADEPGFTMTGDLGGAR